MKTLKVGRHAVNFLWSRRYIVRINTNGNQLYEPEKSTVLFMPLVRKHVYANIRCHYIYWCRARPIISRYLLRDSAARLPGVLFKTGKGEKICMY